MHLTNNRKVVPKQVIILTVILVITIFYIFFKKNKNREPARLIMNKNKRDNKPALSTFVSINGNYQNEKILNVLFEYEGKTYDAYRVFNLPAGSALEDIEKAYDILKGNEKNRDFFLEALLAIRRSK